MKKLIIVIFCAVSQIVMAQSVNVLLFKEKMLISASEADSVTFAIVPTPGEFVDMGFPSGTLWASHNIGASLPEEYGYYYAWGEIYTKSTYTMDTYKWGKKINKYPWSEMTKYCINSEDGEVDNKMTLDNEDDVAYVQSNGLNHIPSPAQIEELVNPDYTQQTRTTLNGVDGWIVFSKFNGNSLFFPSSGYKDTSLWENGKHITLWSNTTYYYCSSSYSLNDSGGKLIKGYYMRDCGCPVRPVRDTIK